MGTGDRRVLYCLIPLDLAGQLHDMLRRHFAERGDVEVVVERRVADRRADADRRSATDAARPQHDRRRVRGPMGRRIAERRASLVPGSFRPALPRRARRHADRIVFVERLEPSTEETENRDTARLIARIQRGDREAFTQLYDRYFDRVYRYLRVALRDPHEAEDGTQQVFLKVFEALPEFERRGRPFRNWLFAVVRNYAISQLRKSGRIEVEEQERIAGRREAEIADEPTIAALDWLSDRDLLLFVERLPLVQRQVLVLRYLMDLSNTEVAEILSRSPDDVKTQHYRAVRFLRQRLSAVGRAPARRGDRAHIWPVFRQAEVLRHRRFALH